MINLTCFRKKQRKYSYVLHIILCWALGNRLIPSALNWKEKMSYFLRLILWWHGYTMIIHHKIWYSCRSTFNSLWIDITVIFSTQWLLVHDSKFILLKGLWFIQTNAFYPVTLNKDFSEIHLWHLFFFFWLIDSLFSSCQYCSRHIGKRV